MNIYEIDEEIEKIINNPPVNEETGELIEDEFFMMLTALHEERNKKIENIACAIKNLTALAEALKAEKMSIAKRQQRIEKKIESLRYYLSHILDGEKFETERCAITFRKTTSCGITDESSCINWLQRMGHGICTKLKVEINRAEVLKLLKAGEAVEGAELVTSNSMTVK